MIGIQPRGLRAARATQQRPPARWLVLGGIVAPFFFAAMFTLAGMLRPGYSPIHQAISDLGVGDNAWLLNIGLLIYSLLIIGFAAGWNVVMRPVLSPSWRWLTGGLLSLHGLGTGVAAIFTEAPETLAIHWMVGALLGFFGPVLAFSVAGAALLSNAEWRRWGWALLIASVTTLAVVIGMFWVFAPGTPLAPISLGGLMERVLFIEVGAWHVALGWQLVTLHPPHDA